MAELKYKNINKYYWCAYEGDNVHFGKLETNQKVTTGLSSLESFSTEDELEQKVDSLKYDGYYKKTIEDENN